MSRSLRSKAKSVVKSFSFSQSLKNNLDNDQNMPLPLKESRKINLFILQNHLLKDDFELVYLVTALVPSRHCVLGQLPGQEEPDGGLDLPGGDGGPLVVVSEAAGLK